MREIEDENLLFSFIDPFDLHHNPGARSFNQYKG